MHAHSPRPSVSIVVLALLVALVLLAACTVQTAAQNGNDAVQHALLNLDLPSPASSPVYAEAPSFSVDPLSNSLNLTMYLRAYRVPGAISFNSRVFCTDRDGCAFVGPTWHMRAGSKVNITVVNQLGPDDTPHVLNQFHSPNITNLHTHGLHISPQIDSVFVAIHPSDTYTYHYDVPVNHSPGLHWWHSHLHGASTFQISGGVAGAIVVDASPEDNMPAAMTAMTRHTLVMQQQFLDWPVGFTGTTNGAFAVFSHQMLDGLVGSTMPVDPVYADDNIRDRYLTNNLYQPVLTTYAGEWRVFDIVNAVGSRVLELEVRAGGVGAASTSASATCEIIQIASDGVYFPAMRTGKRLVILFPGSRQSIMLRCTSVGTFYLQSYADASRTPVNTEVRVTQNLLTLSVLAASSAPSPGTLATNLPSAAEFAAIRRPSYLADLTNEVVPAASKWSISTGQTEATDAYGLGIGTDCGPKAAPDACMFESFPGSIIDTPTRYRFISTLDQVEELTIWGGGVTPHPMHIHVNHMQLMSYTPNGNGNNNGPNTDYTLFGEFGDWRDTWPAMIGSTVLRLKPADFLGEAMVHCHFLKHEDRGMMASIGIHAQVNTSGDVPNTATKSGAGIGMSSASSAAVAIALASAYIGQL